MRRFHWLFSCVERFFMRDIFFSMKFDFLAPLRAFFLLREPEYCMKKDAHIYIDSVNICKFATALSETFPQCTYICVPFDMRQLSERFKGVPRIFRSLINILNVLLQLTFLYTIYRVCKKYIFMVLTVSEILTTQQRIEWMHCFL